MFQFVSRIIHFTAVTAAPVSLVLMGLGAHLTFGVPEQGLLSAAVGVAACACGLALLCGLVVAFARGLRSKNSAAAPTAPIRIVTDLDLE